MRAATDTKIFLYCPDSIQGELGIANSRSLSQLLGENWPAAAWGSKPEIFRLSAVVFVICCISTFSMLAWVKGFPSRIEQSKHIESLSGMKLASVDGRRTQVEPKASQGGTPHPPLQSHTDTPANFTIVIVYLPRKSSYEPQFCPTKRADATVAVSTLTPSLPALDIFSGKRIDLRLPQTRELSHTTIYPWTNPVPKRRIGSPEDVEVPPSDIAAISENERGALYPYPTDSVSHGLTDRTGATLSENSSDGMTRDAKAVIAVLGKYSEAWNTMQIAEITALKPGLSRRVVEQELSGARSITMRIQPTSDPRIQGNLAKVDCIHEVAQVFKDGVSKANPGIKMTYVLVRHGSTWRIQ